MLSEVSGRDRVIFFKVQLTAGKLNLCRNHRLSWDNLTERQVWTAIFPQTHFYAPERLPRIQSLNSDREAYRTRLMNRYQGDFYVAV